jgi:hypothetical protein
MKKLYYLLLICVLSVASCQKPQYIPPTAERQGITSLTAYFTNTSEKYEGAALAKLNVEDPEADMFVIPVPWFYPEESTDPTSIHMTKVRLKAELAPNCRIDPPLSIVDLTEENYYTFTNAQGESREIIITGKRTKSAKCNLMTFTLTKPYQIEGFIDESKKEVYLFTTDDLTGFSAEATVCPHATVQTDLSVAKDYNKEQEVTVMAQDEKTTCTYKIIKKYPTKIPYGFRVASARQLFNINPVARLNFPEAKETVYSTLAYFDGKLVISLGNGTTPIFCDPLTGVQQGEINDGGIDIAAITNDEGGNILVSTHAESKGTVTLYKTKSVAAAPEQFHSFTNETDVPVGYNLKVNGNIDQDAVIILSHEGIDNMTATSKYTKIVITGGQVVSTETIDLSGLGLSWGSAPVHGAKIVPVSNKPETGVMLCYYTDNILHYVVDGEIKASRDLANDGATSNYNTNVMEAKSFNNAPYVIHLVSSHFPMWGIEPQLRIWDASDPKSIKDAAPIIENHSTEWFQTGYQGCAAADVVMGTSADGFKVYIYYWDHNACVIAGFVADCIDI